MSSITLAIPTNSYKPFFLKNDDRSIRKLEPKPENDFISTNREIFNRTKKDLESSVIATTEERNHGYEELITLKALYIDERNEILDNFFKCLMPKYKKQLREIDQRLDQIDMKIYSFETANSLKESDLANLILAGEKKIEKYAEYLQTLEKKDKK